MKFPKDIGGSPTRWGSFFSLFFLPCRMGPPTSLVASFVSIVGHEGTDGGLCCIIPVVIIVETFADSGSRWVHDSFAIRACALMVHNGVASLQPVVVDEVLVFFQHFLSDSLQHVVAAHLRQDGLQTDRLAVHLTLVQAPDRCVLTIP